MRFEGRVALVTGGDRGIGRAVSLRLAHEGALVAVNYLSRKAEAEETVALARGAGVKSILAQGDISDAGEAESVIRKVQDHLGLIDILVNNAGIQGPNARLQDIHDSEWDQVIAVNLRGPFFCCRAVLPSMMKWNSGKILNVASIAARSGYGNHAAYSASKAGLLGLSRSLALEVAPFNIQVNCVAPGITATEMADSLSEDQRERILGGIPMGRMATPDEVASLVTFLCSQESSYITGQVFDVSGGRGQ